MIADHLSEIVTNTFHRKADIRRQDESGDLRFMINWRLVTSHGRPGKRSKLIELRISREAVADYGKGSERQQAAADEKLASHLKSWLKDFDPDHDSPAEAAPPREQWVVTTEMLNS